MNSSATPASAAPAGYHEESIQQLPAAARAALARFQTDRDPAALDIVLFAILGEFLPKPPDRPLAELPGDTRLMDDLNFDSIALTEVVFYAEEVFAITITNEEIVAVRTLAALRDFIHGKVAARTAR